jgi:uncharacterized protein YdeI (YjbR/CyaY-like superfamily)
VAAGQGVCQPPLVACGLVAERAELPVLACASAADWEQWLARNHTSGSGVWLQIVRKNAGVAGVSYAEAVEAALCFGWIDGQARPFDERFWLQRFTPRRARSHWSRSNRERVARLSAAGRMRAAGQAQVEAAQADGRWPADPLSSPRDAGMDPG